MRWNEMKFGWEICNESYLCNDNERFVKYASGNNIKWDYCILVALVLQIKKKKRGVTFDIFGEAGNRNALKCLKKCTQISA